MKLIKRELSKFELYYAELEKLKINKSDFVENILKFLDYYLLDIKFMFVCEDLRGQKMLETLELITPDTNLNISGFFTDFGKIFDHTDYDNLDIAKAHDYKDTFESYYHVKTGLFIFGIFTNLEIYITKIYEKLKESESLELKNYREERLEYETYTLLKKKLIANNIYLDEDLYKEIKQSLKKDHIDFDRKLRYMAKTFSLDFEVDFKILSVLAKMRNSLHSDGTYTGANFIYHSKSGKVLELVKNTQVEFGGYDSQTKLNLLEIIQEVIAASDLIENAYI